MDSTFYGYDERLDISRTEHLEIRSAVGRHDTPMVEIIATVGPKRATVFLPAEVADRVAAALIAARRDAEMDAGHESVPPHPRAGRGSRVG
jgi:hypothetical protein